MFFIFLLANKHLRCIYMYMYALKATSIVYVLNTEQNNVKPVM